MLACEPSAARPGVGTALRERQEQAAGGSPAGSGGLAAASSRSSAVAAGTCRAPAQRGWGSQAPGKAGTPSPGSAG